MGAYVCIDLKSFYASVECVERGLDPFKTNLVVADPDRSKSTICLAITPAMKKLGVKNRCRVHEIPANIKYITAMPRMRLYIEYSTRIYGLYLRYISPEDIHVYSIDECFIDVEPYLKLYNKTPKEMASMLMDIVMKETKITATAGVGTNLYLAKIAMDILAKHVDDNIGCLDEMEFRKMMWGHRPLTDFWMIGPATAKKLEDFGMNTMGDIAKTSIVAEDWFFKKFGIDAELLIDHAWGEETCTMRDIKNYHSLEHSLSSGQVLMRNYSFEEARIIVKEMTDALVLDMVDKRIATNSFSLWISYDHKFGLAPTGGSVRLESVTSSSSRIISAMEQLYYRITDRYTGIRRVTISANKIVPETSVQFDLFTNSYVIAKEQELQHAMVDIRHRYGNNAIFRGINLLECSTYRERNDQIGGHRA